MVIKIRWSDNAVKDYETIVNYLRTAWNEDIALRFMEVVEFKVNQIRSHPFIRKMTVKVKNVRSVLLTKHNKLYYRCLTKHLIEIVNIYHTRQNPAKNVCE